LPERPGGCFAQSVPDRFSDAPACSGKGRILLPGIALTHTQVVARSPDVAIWPTENLSEILLVAGSIANREVIPSPSLSGNIQEKPCITAVIGIALPDFQCCVIGSDLQPLLWFSSKLRQRVPSHREAARYRQPLQNSIQHVDSAKRRAPQRARRARRKSQIGDEPIPSGEFRILCDLASFVVEILFVFPWRFTRTWWCWQSRVENTPHCRWRDARPRNPPAPERAP
jgi:hypothetical protein